MKRILIIIIACLTALALPAKKKEKYTPKYTRSQYIEWAERIAASQIKHDPALSLADGVKKPKWDYTQTLVGKAMVEIYRETGKSDYIDYVTEYADQFIEPDGNIKTYKMRDYNIDRVNGGNMLYALNEIRPRAAYLMAIDTLRKQLASQPRTSEGGFWHKKIYPHQMWLDGLYMAEPFYAHYASNNNIPELFDDIANQFITVDKHTLDTKTGLNYHGWDESREQQWADKTTGCSPNFWGRSIGWYVMALCDVLDYMPVQHPKRQQLIDILNRVINSLMKYQDKKTKMWYQVIDKPNGEGNYTESSASIMFIYAMAKGARNGYLPDKYLKTARDAFSAFCLNAVETNSDGTLSITRCCAVAGLGGKPYRSGTYEYYVNERVRNDDPKAVGPFILAALELAKATPHYTVAKDGSGDFKTVQEAINAVSPMTKERVYINIEPGIYNERVNIDSSRQMISLIGSRKGEVRITNDLGAKQTDALNRPVGTSGTATLYVFGNDIYLENITIENNSTNGQAVAAMIDSDRFLARDCRFIGNQDTLYPHRDGSRQMYQNCYIEGTTDFIFGWATAVFSNCRIHSKKNSYITAASTEQHQPYGFVFLNCDLTAANGINNVYLGRPWRIYAKTVFIHCHLAEHIAPQGWHNWNKPEAQQTAFYAEYENYGDGADISARVDWSRQLTEQQAAQYTPQKILAGNDHWNPLMPMLIQPRK